MPNILKGTIIVEKDYPDEMSLMEALEAFGDEFDVDPDTVNGKVFVGICDGCSKIILEDEIYAESEDDDIRCAVCIDKNQRELADKKFKEDFEAGGEIPPGEETPAEQSSSPSSDDMHGECSMPVDMQEEQMRDEGYAEEEIQDFFREDQGEPDWPLVCAESEDPEDL